YGALSASAGIYTGNEGSGTYVSTSRRGFGASAGASGEVGVSTSLDGFMGESFGCAAGAGKWTAGIDGNENGLTVELNGGVGTPINFSCQQSDTHKTSSLSFRAARDALYSFLSEHGGKEFARFIGGGPL